MSPFREIAVLTPHSQNRQPAYRLKVVPPAPGLFHARGYRKGAPHQACTSHHTLAKVFGSWPPGGGANLKSRTLRLYSRVVACEIRKIEVFYIEFSRPSPESKSGWGIH